MNKRPILGLIEDITIFGKSEKKLVARVDSGATASSIDKKLADSLELGPVVREKVVKSASGVNKRPIIKVKVKVDDQILEVEFTVANRAHMTYPILIGQNLLKEGRFLIDPLKKVSK